MTPSPIIYLLGSYPKWSETFVRRDLTLLIELGLPIIPVTLFPGDTPQKKDWPRATILEKKAKLPPRLEKSAENNQQPVWLTLPPMTLLRARFSLFKHRQLLRSLMALAIEKKACHIHAEFADLPALLAAKAARKLGISHSLGVHAKDVHIQKFPPSSLYRGASFITACNRAAWSKVAPYGNWVPEGIHLIHHGIELAKWPFKSDFFQPQKVLRLAFAGRFVEKKGLSVLFKAMTELKQQGIQTSLDLFGNGPLENPLRELAATLEIEDQIHWRGLIPYEELPEKLRETDILVMPCIETKARDQDGIPNIIVESMALGLPVVGSVVGSLAEILTPETSWPFAAGDAHSLATTLTTLRNSLGQAEQKRQAARDLVVHNFTSKRLVRQRAALFQKIISQ